MRLEDITYDEALQMLNDRVALLEESELSLEELRRTVAECDSLISYCHQELRNVRNHVECVTEKWSKLD